MIKHVLVPLTGEAGDSSVLATALLVARPFAAHLECLHVAVDITEVVVSMSATGGGGGGVQGVVDDLDAANRNSEQHAWQSFITFCTEAGISAGDDAPGDVVTADLVLETGDSAHFVPDYGRFADMVVLGRTPEGQEPSRDVLEAALMDTGRPLLLAPETPPDSLLDTVAIAWEESPEAFRAVYAAMPLLDLAERIVILSVTADTDAPDTTADRLAESLRRHNATVTTRHLAHEGRDIVDVLLDQAKDLGATLLVMGGYSRSRLREAVFGGATQRILETAPLPVLMAH